MLLEVNQHLSFLKLGFFYRDENTCYARVYPDGDPRQPWSEHINDYWLQRSLYPQDQYEGSIYQIPLLSTKTAVTFSYFMVLRGFGRKQIIFSTANQKSCFRRIRERNHNKRMERLLDNGF